MHWIWPHCSPWPSCAAWQGCQLEWRLRNSHPHSSRGLLQSAQLPDKIRTRFSKELSHTVSSLFGSNKNKQNARQLSTPVSYTVFMPSQVVVASVLLSMVALSTPYFKESDRLLNILDIDCQTQMVEKATMESKTEAYMREHKRLYQTQVSKETRHFVWATCQDNKITVVGCLHVYMTLA